MVVNRGSLASGKSLNFSEPNFSVIHKMSLSACPACLTVLQRRANEINGWENPFLIFKNTPPLCVHYLYQSQKQYELESLGSLIRTFEFWSVFHHTGYVSHSVI